MAKKKKEEQDAVVAELMQEKPLLIVQGSLPDENCNYSVQINTGPTKGMVHNVKGKPNIVHDDLREAFQKFRPHFASLCDKISNDECENFAALSNRQEVDLCHVTGFKIKGAGESESICLVGSYHSMNAQGRIECTTNYVSLEGSDGYKWYNELRDVADEVRSEIEQYNDGKCTPPEETVVVPKNQKNILQEIEELDN
jgi:hypothetical protein